MSDEHITKGKYDYRTCDNSYEDEKGSFLCGTHDTNYTVWYMDFPNDDLYHFTLGEVITNIGKDLHAYKINIVDIIHYKRGYIRYRIVPIGSTTSIPFQHIGKGTQWRRV